MKKDLVNACYRSSFLHFGFHGAKGQVQDCVPDGRDCADAGAFSLVYEGMVEPVARSLALSCPVPTIGIGASCACDGQILVSEDMLGLFDDFKPKFVHQFSNLSFIITAAAAAYR